MLKFSCLNNFGHNFDVTWTRIIICVWVHGVRPCLILHITRSSRRCSLTSLCFIGIWKIAQTNSFACRLNQWKVIFKEVQIYGVIERVLEPVVAHWPNATASLGILDSTPGGTLCILDIRTLMKYIRILRSEQGVGTCMCRLKKSHRWFWYQTHYTPPLRTGRKQAEE